MNIRTSCLGLAVAIAGLTLLPHSTDASTASFVETAVRTYFKETPVMVEIARCESKFRQFDASGSPLRGGWGGGMVGVFQFYGSVHRGGAMALGFDIDTLEGNLAYAKHLFTVSGTTPWNSSKTCWGNAVTSAASSKLSDAEIAALQARIEVLKKIVAELQLLLEKKKVAIR